uniref:Uncharacterized protein n=1 Tax=Ixodes ricinus TaxID=34613 RepID=A0A147BGJ1_IXORI
MTELRFRFTRAQCRSSFVSLFSRLFPSASACFNQEIVDFFVVFILRFVWRQGERFFFFLSERRFCYALVPVWFTPKIFYVVLSSWRVRTLSYIYIYIYIYIYLCASSLRANFFIAFLFVFNCYNHFIVFLFVFFTPQTFVERCPQSALVQGHLQLQDYTAATLRLFHEQCWAGLETT